MWGMEVSFHELLTVVLIICELSVPCFAARTRFRRMAVPVPINFWKGVGYIYGRSQTVHNIPLKQSPISYTSVNITPE
jgi:hypothetical protein